MKDVSWYYVLWKLKLCFWNVRQKALEPTLVTKYWAVHYLLKKHNFQNQSFLFVCFLHFFLILSVVRVMKCACALDTHKNSFPYPRLDSYFQQNSYFTLDYFSSTKTSDGWLSVWHVLPWRWQQMRSVIILMASAVHAAGAPAQFGSPWGTWASPDLRCHRGECRGGSEVNQVLKKAINKTEAINIQN